MKQLNGAKFNIENLGYIKRGEFEVKPLTLFCGKNNTGKTWAMYALYGCLDRLPSGMPIPGLDEIVSSLIKEGSAVFDLQLLVQTHYKDLARLIKRGCQLRLSTIFNAEQVSFDNTVIDWMISKEQMLHVIMTEELDFRLELGKQVDALRLLKPRGETTVSITLLAEKLPDLKRYLSDVIVRFLLQQKDGRNVFLVPAERNGLHLFFRELSSRRSALLHHVSREELDVTKLISDIMKSRYAEPIADYIDWLNGLRTRRKTKGAECHDSADALRKTLIGGKYEVDSEGVISFTPRKIRGQPSAEKMSLHLTSSAIKSLFGIWFFLEHQAKPGDILMIDEPELNLHPAAQREIARLLAAVANKGITVIVSTHSDYFVREINTLIMLSKAHPRRDELMQKYGYVPEQLLELDDVGAYYFDETGINPMQVNEEEGIFVETFDQVIRDLNDTSDDIYYQYRDDQDLSDLV
ncbi:AAA family ATPase [Herbaspirillum sp. DW155]|uniref:AAA family ATPase n=1 Tax=Herbaspirillum sp. DW155 TaxID=3095609 RepID=UPI003086396E|nr:AAA family ATPase [Herbaspirillum sp. DW155]